jgi:hypothetical protein
MKLAFIGLFLLIVILLIIILHSNIYINREGVKNKLSNTDITEAKEFINTFNKTVEDNSCKKAVDILRTINSGNSKDINKIINENLDLSNCAVVEKISALKNDENVSKIIHSCYGEKYEAVLNLITNLKSTNIYKNDEDFTDFLNNIKQPSISGDKSTSIEIENYIDLMTKLQDTK